VTKEQGPLKIRGLFVGNKIVSTRTYAKKNVFIVERVAPGDVELLLVPAGKVERRTVGDGGEPSPPPKPKPDPEPKPDPKPDPVPDVDAALLAKFKNALAADLAAGQGTKQHAADLAVVFESGAALLDLNDPAIAPRTVGQLTEKMVNASVAKGVPRPPYLKSVRAVVEGATPILNGQTELTPALKAEFQAKYRAVAVALGEATK